MCLAAGASGATFLQRVWDSSVWARCPLLVGREGTGRKGGKMKKKTKKQKSKKSKNHSTLFGVLQLTGTNTTTFLPRAAFNPALNY